MYTFKYMIINLIIWWVSNHTFLLIALHLAIIMKINHL